MSGVGTSLDLKYLDYRLETKLSEIVLNYVENKILVFPMISVSLILIQDCFESTMTIGLIDSCSWYKMTIETLDYSKRIIAHLYTN